MRHTTAGILAILAIALSVFFSIGGFESMTIQPALTGRVVIETSSVPSSTLEPQQPESEATLVLANGRIPAGSILTIRDTISFDTGSVDTITINLLGSTEKDLVFRVQRAPVPEAFTPKGGSVIATYQSSNGAYGALSTAELASIRATTGSGWYVFTAERPSGTILSIPFFLR